MERSPPSQTGARAPRVRLALFAVCLLSYAYFYQAGGWNQNTRLDLTRALVEQRGVRIDAYADNTGDLAARDGHLYCDKAPGLSWLATPVYALMTLDGTPPDAARLNLATYAMTVVTLGVPTALAVVLLFDLLVAWGVGAGWSVSVALGWGLATLALPYSTLLYGHQLAAVLLFVAYALLLRDAPATRGTALAIGACLGIAVTVEYPALPAALLLGALALRRGRAWLLPMIVAALPPVALLALYHALAFGAPTTLPYDFSTMPYRHMGYFMGLGLPRPATLHELTFGGYRGLFHSAPWLLLAVPGTWLWWRHGRRVEAGCAAALALLFLWLNASLVDWMGGWAFGPRYLVTALPFLALLAGGVGFAREHAPAAARPLVLAAALTLAWSWSAMLIGTAVKPEVPMGIARPFAEFLVPQFAADRVAISTQGVHMKWPTKDGVRQAWNLGERLGLAGRASLVPLLLAQGALGAWLWWTLRRRVASP